MNILKTKTYNQISLSELKEFMQVDESDLTMNGLLTRLLKAAIGEAENYTNDDIITTTSVLEENSYLSSFCYIDYPIYFTNVRINSIQIATGFGTGATLNTLANTEYAVEKFSSYTNIRFKASILGTRLIINYSSGWSSIPETVKTAIFMKVGSFLDIERNGYVSTSINNVKAFERLLSPYVNSIF